MRILDLRRTAASSRLWHAGGDYLGFGVPHDPSSALLHLVLVCLRARLQKSHNALYESDFKVSASQKTAVPSNSETRAMYYLTPPYRPLVPSWPGVAGVA